MVNCLHGLTFEPLLSAATQCLQRKLRADQNIPIGLLARASLAASPPPAHVLQHEQQSAPSSAVDALNRRWAEGRPSTTWESSGAVVYMLDLGGVGVGMPLSSVDVSDPLGHLWTPDGDSPGGDRVSTSLINRRHPEVFRCMPPVANCAHGADLPGLVLR